ncbi:MAG: hypothetical protein FWG74_00965 [Planctomycetes bacterium]|nr:hypothetical protein [Planctomycetota bacterium]
MALLPSNVLGLEARLYVGAVGATQSTLAVTANEVTCARSVELSLTSSMADVTTRGSDYRLQRRALKEASINVELIYSPSDANFKKLFDSYDKGEAIGLFVSDGHGSGLLCDASVTEFSQPQPLEDIITVNAVLVPTFASRYPVWISASGS